MKTTRALITIPLAAVLVLSGCGDDSSTDASPGAGGDTVTTAAGGDPGGNTDSGGSSGGSGGQAGDGALMATVELTLIGGPDEGDHSAEARGTGCTRNPMGDNTFGLQYSRDDQSGFHSLQILVNDLDEAAGGGTDQFTATASIGSARYHLGRTGSITVDDQGDTAVISYEGFTDDGVDVSAQVTCHTVVGLG